MKYTTEVIQVGPEAPMFLKQDIMILSGENTSDNLAEYYYTVNIVPVNDFIQVNDQLFIDEQSYTITAVGCAVQKNLADLGYITINFNGTNEVKLPGTLYVEADQATTTQWQRDCKGALHIVEANQTPTIEVGTKITIQ